MKKTSSLLLILAIAVFGLYTPDAFAQEIFGHGADVENPAMSEKLLQTLKSKVANSPEEDISPRKVITSLWTTAR